MIAFGVAAAVRDAGLQLGVDVLLAGFDDVKSARYEQTPLTSVAAGPMELGRRSAQLLADKIAQVDSPGETISEIELMVRQSCGCHDRVGT